MSEYGGANSALVWQVDSADSELGKAVKEKLREVIDPEIGLNVIELGLIRDVEVAEDKANVRMMLTTPFCPYGPAMLEQTRKSAEEVLARPTTIEMSPELWDPSYMEEGAGADWGLF
jgi:metal-sulfur cluster biosynthetic enzyme